MNMKKINIMLGGVFPKEILSSNLWCGVDKGALYLLNNGVNPILSCGDFDSITLEQKRDVEEKSKYFKVKSSEDLTDAEFALEHILELFKEVEVIDIYGATGRRVPIYEDTLMTIKNSKYEVENLFLTLNRPNATSNEFKNNEEIKLEVSNNVLVVYSKD